MAVKSDIEWTDSSWTPIRARNLKTGKVGWHCEHATTGCEFCYSEGFNKRLGTGLAFKPGHRKDIEIFLDADMLIVPLKWRKPRMIFVCSMTDIFADFVTDEWLDQRTVRSSTVVNSRVTTSPSPTTPSRSATNDAFAAMRAPLEPRRERCRDTSHDVAASAGKSDRQCGKACRR